MENNVNKYSNNLIWTSPNKTPIPENGTILKTVELTKNTSEKKAVNWPFPCIIMDTNQTLTCKFSLNSMYEKLNVPQLNRNQKLQDICELLLFSEKFKEDSLSQDDKPFLEDRNKNIEITKPKNLKEFQNVISFKFKTSRGMTSFKDKSSWTISLKIHDWTINLVTGLFILSNQSNFNILTKKIYLGKESTLLDLLEQLWWYKEEFHEEPTSKRKKSKFKNKKENNRSSIDLQDSPSSRLFQNIEDENSSFKNASKKQKTKTNTTHTSFKTYFPYEDINFVKQEIRALKKDKNLIKNKIIEKKELLDQLKNQQNNIKENNHFSSNIPNSFQLFIPNEINNNNHFSSNIPNSFQLFIPNEINNNTIPNVIEELEF